MTTQEFMSLIQAIGSIIVAVIAVLTYVRVWVVSKEINGMKDALIKAEKKVSKAEGVKEGEANAEEQANTRESSTR